MGGIGASSRIGPRHGARDATTVAAELSKRQFGAVARRQLLAAGIGRRQVQSWLDRGLLHGRYSGVYAWGREKLAVEGQLAAALLYAGVGAALGDLTALWWRKLLGHRPARIHIDAPGGRASRADIVIRHPRRVQRELHRGLPVTPLPQALLAASAHLSHQALRLVLARAEFERQLSPAELDRALGPGRPGTRALRAAMGAHLPQLAHCENGLERRYLLLCEASGLELPEVNVRVGRRRPDMLWRERRLVVELDGERAHSTPAQLAADAERQRELEARGLRVVRFSRPEVVGEPAQVMARTRAGLAGGLATAPNPQR